MNGKRESALNREPLFWEALLSLLYALSPYPMRAWKNRIYDLPVAHHRALTHTLGYHHKGNPEEQCCVCFSVS